MSSNTKKMVTGAAILAAAGILAKVLSMFFRIPLANDLMLGDVGIGYYQLPYPIYSLLISVSYLGLPAAISKLVSEKLAKEKYKEAHDIFKHTFIILIAFGFLSSLFMFLGADWLIETNEWAPEAKWSIYGLALAPFFVAFMGAFRGYFQGMQKMTPTGVSQVIESLARVICGVGLAWYVLYRVDRNNLGLAAGGASFGATAGAIVGTIYLLIVYFANRKNIKANFEKDKGSVRVGFRKCAMIVFGVALPITLGAAINSVISLIDSTVVVARLQTALGYSETLAHKLYGILSGKATTLINAPLTISSALVLSIMPAVSEAHAKEDEKELRDKIDLGLRLVLLIGLPATAGLVSMSGPLMQLLYGKQTGGGQTLAILSLCLIFVMIGQLLATVLQGIGRFYLPICNLLIAAVFKFILTYVLCGIEFFNIDGACYATLATYLIYGLLNYYFVKKITKFKTKSIMQTLLKPLFATALMVVATLGSYALLSMLDLNFRIVTLLSVMVAVIVYFLTLLLTKTLKEEDYDSIPGGAKLLRLFKKMHLA